MTLSFLGAAWLAGVFAGKLADQPLLNWLALAALAVAAAIALRRDATLRLALACAAAFALGGARYRASLPNYTPDFVSTYNSDGDTRDAVLEGVVTGEPDARDLFTYLRVRAEYLLLPDDPAPRRVSGLVLVQAERPPDYQYGDRLRISGQLQTPPSFADFSYADYLARQGVHSVIWRAGVTPMAAGQGNPLLARLYRFKGRALRTLETLFPQPHAALLQGILLGVESGIPRALKDDFSATGTSR